MSAPCPPDCDRPKIATVFVGNKPISSCFVDTKKTAVWPPGSEVLRVRDDDVDAAAAVVGRLVERGS